MSAIDVPTLINWIVAGFIGVVFGFSSAYFTYRLERRRDDLKWQRELEKLRMEFELKARQWQKEHDKERTEGLSDRINSELTQGLDDPEKAIQSLRALDSLTRSPSHSGRRFNPLDSILDSIRSRRRFLSSIAVFVGFVLGVIIAIIVYSFLAGVGGFQIG